MGNLTRGNTLPLWMGAAQAKQRDWHPAKGSKAARIMRPRPVTVEEEPLTPGEPGSVRSICTYRRMPVFNAADLATEDPDAAADLTRRIDEALGQAGASARPEAERLYHAEWMLEAWSVRSQFGGARACYSPGADAIAMPAARAFTNREHFFTTWAHEQVQSTDHASRLARPISGSLGSASYAKEELVAELGAAILCRRLEIGCQIEYHASYLTGWCGGAARGAQGRPVGPGPGGEGGRPHRPSRWGGCGMRRTTKPADARCPTRSAPSPIRSP